jgi:hypothetical protein
MNLDGMDDEMNKFTQEAKSSEKREWGGGVGQRVYSLRCRHTYSVM